MRESRTKPKGRKIWLMVDTLLRQIVRSAGRSGARSLLMDLTSWPSATVAPRALPLVVLSHRPHRRCLRRCRGIRKRLGTIFAAEIFWAKRLSASPTSICV